MGSTRRSKGAASHALMILGVIALSGCSKEFAFSFSPSADFRAALIACEGGGSETVALPLLVTGNSNASTNVTFVIDTSGSMANEIDQVRTNMNQFVNVVKSTLDTNTTKFAVIGTDREGADVLPAPYVKDGTYNQVYWHHEEVQSKDKLQILMRAYGMTSYMLNGTSRSLGTNGSPLPNFSPTGACNSTGTLFNCNALNHVVIVTDDIEALPGTSNQNTIRNSFLSSFASHLAANQSAFKLHAIHGKQNSSCNIARYGQIYEELAAATGGLSFDVCSANWSTLFDALKDSIVTSAKGVQFGQCSSASRRIDSLKVTWGTGNEVILSQGSYTYSNPVGGSPSIYVSAATLESKGVPVDGTPLTLVIQSSW